MRAFVFTSLNWESPVSEGRGPVGVQVCPGLGPSLPLDADTRVGIGLQTAFRLTNCRLSLQAREVPSPSPGGCPCAYKSRRVALHCETLPWGRGGEGTVASCCP